ncbi:unnamed protein product [Blumeria hordei]|uniref:GPI mannosyltransferase 2 n=1 Tax=Blumeria hordei TaxID=2867405 RepID=A0A383UMP5_BLUHO|nr:unnamed protein product [Blumeria hordei]
MPPWSQLSAHPLKSLTAIFLCWKVLLLIVASISPGPGYDTSTNISINAQENKLPLPLRYIVEKLVRWDAVYYSMISNRGYLFEQEWAFGWGWTRLIALCTAGLQNFGFPEYDGIESLVAIVLAHASHYISVIELYYLTSIIFAKESLTFAITSAILYVFSPAGIFLSAPYAESSCALLSFAGSIAFLKSFGRTKNTWSDAYLLLSGLLFGISTTFRSNGILNGLLLLEEAFRSLWAFRNGFELSKIRRLFATTLGGIFVAAGFLLPQYLAYREYCIKNILLQRPWCDQAIPSIYTFVQSHYWGVGLFRYWKLSNLPLFILATPMLMLMIVSGAWATAPLPSMIKIQREHSKIDGASQTLRNLAVSQILLAFLTLTTAHVQIINRISSSHPVWIWLTAAILQDGKGKVHQYIIRFIVIYGLVQAGLYSSFLPPA